MKRFVVALFALSLGCDAVVDGSCAEGYLFCDDACRPIADCHRRDAAAPIDSSSADSAEIDSSTIDSTTVDSAEIDAADSSMIDSAEADSSTIDSAPVDSETVDSAPVDSGAVDSALADTAAVDSTVVDSSLVDSATIDSAIVDSGVDTAVPDTCPSPPYVTATNCGACGVTCSGATPSCKAGLDGTYACGPVCDAPTTQCPAGCVDLDVDPNNCGGCGKTCATGLCNGGRCRGAKTGHVVVVGHDYSGATPTVAASRVLVNAVFLPPKNPVRVLAYQQWSEPAAVSSIKAILDAGAAARGRTYAMTVATSLASFRDQLLIDNFEVALVLDQPNAPAGALGVVGSSASLSLDSFSRVGGVVVVLDGGSGVSQMPQFLTASTMLGTSGHTTITGKSVDVVAPSDPIASGVLGPYVSPTRSVSFSVTDPPSSSLVTVVSEPVATRPVVLHKTVLK